MFTSFPDGEYEVYIDGDRVIKAIGSNSVMYNTIDQNASILAVSVLNKKGLGGFRGALSDGRIADESWKCSSVYSSGWQNVAFDDSKWPLAIFRSDSKTQVILNVCITLMVLGAS